MTCRLLLLPLLMTCTLSPALRAEERIVEDRMAIVAPPEEYPGLYTYRAQLMKSEKAYQEQVLKARAAYLEELKGFRARARMTQEAAKRLNTEIKRIESLPKPVVIPEPKAES